MNAVGACGDVGGGVHAIVVLDFNASVRVSVLGDTYDRTLLSPWTGELVP